MNGCGVALGDFSFSFQVEWVAVNQSNFIHASGPPDDHVCRSAIEGEVGLGRREEMGPCEHRDSFESGTQKGSI